MIKNAIKAGGLAIDVEDSIETAQAVYMDLLAYLTSSKFHEDTTVQVADVLRRIQPIQGVLLDAAHEIGEVRKLLAPRSKA